MKGTRIPAAKDPILFAGGDANLYGYVVNDPVNIKDVDGYAPKDKTFGLPKQFWNWHHRQVKERGNPDLTREEAEELFDEWKRKGKPNSEGKRNVCEEPQDEEPEQGDSDKETKERGLEIDKDTLVKISEIASKSATAVLEALMLAIIVAGALVSSL